MELYKGDIVLEIVCLRYYNKNLIGLEYIYISENISKYFKNKKVIL